jgi:DNA invertase Pin-like site-specific DNA recombinase
MTPKEKKAFVARMKKGRAAAKKKGKKRYKPDFTNVKFSKEDYSKNTTEAKEEKFLKDIEDTLAGKTVGGFTTRWRDEKVDRIIELSKKFGTLAYNRRFRKEIGVE